MKHKHLLPSYHLLQTPPLAIYPECERNSSPLHFLFFNLQFSIILAPLTFTWSLSFSSPTKIFYTFLIIPLCAKCHTHPI